MAIKSKKIHPRQNISTYASTTNTARAQKFPWPHVCMWAILQKVKLHHVGSARIISNDYFATVTWSLQKIKTAPNSLAAGATSCRQQEYCRTNLKNCQFSFTFASQFSATKTSAHRHSCCIHSLSWMKATCLGTDRWQCVVKAVICLQLLSSTSRSIANKANTTILPVIRKYFSCFLKMGSNCHYDNSTWDTGAIHMWPKTRPLNASMRIALRSLWFQDTCIKDCRKS